MAKTVYSKAEMRQALEADASVIIAKSELAQEIRKICKPMKGAKQGSELLAAGSLLAAPFAAGVSLAITLAAGLVIGSASISAAKFAMMLGGTAAVSGIVKDIKRVYLCPNGSVIMEFN